MKFGFWVLKQWDSADNMTQRINEGVEQVKFAREALSKGEKVFYQCSW